MLIGIGVGEQPEKIFSSIKNLNEKIEIALFCNEGAGVGAPDSCVVIESNHPEIELVNALMDESIDAAVRGTLPAGETLGALKEASGVDRLARLALLETPSGKKFFLAPVGVDEGWDLVEKIIFVDRAKMLSEAFGLGERVAVLSGGRYGDIGRCPQVDRSLADGELVSRITGAEHLEILIEDAIGKYGAVIAPDGISGNLIFRTLVLVGGGKGHGAVVLNTGRVFVDTSRASPDYRNAILLAAAFLND